MKQLRIHRQVGAPALLPSEPVLRALKIILEPQEATHGSRSLSAIPYERWCGVGNVALRTLASVNGVAADSTCICIMLAPGTIP